MKWLVWVTQSTDSGVGHTKTGSQDDGDDRAKLHGEATRGRHEGDSVSKVAHDVVAISPETEDDTSTTKGKNPERHLSLLSGNITRLPDLIDGGVRTNSIGNIVGAVDERGRSGSHDLEEGIEELGTVVVVSSAGVDLLDVTGNNGLFALGADDILVDTVQDGKLDSPPDESTSVPGPIGLGADKRLVLEAVGSLGGFLGSVVDGNLLLMVGLKIPVGLGSTLSAAGLELLTSEMSLVEVADNTLEVLRRGRNGATAEEHGTEEHVVALELPVLLDNDSVQPGDKSESHEETPAGTRSNDDTRDLGIGEVDLVRATLPDEKHDDEGGSEPEVEGDQDETLHGGVLSEEDTILCEEEDEGAKDTREDWGNDPCEENLEKLH